MRVKKLVVAVIGGEKELVRTVVVQVAATALARHAALAVGRHGRVDGSWIIIERMQHVQRHSRGGHVAHSCSQGSGG